MRRAIPIQLSDAERETLTNWTRSRTAPARLVTRARIVLAAAAGRENQEIAAELGLARSTVVCWRKRFAAERLTGVGFVCGGDSEARLARRLGMPTSPDALLRCVRQSPALPAGVPRVLGVDDWALRCRLSPKSVLPQSR